MIKIPKISEDITKVTDTLNYIEKQLENLLELKRNAFPRFYFLSNDELVEILANSREIQAL